MPTERGGAPRIEEERQSRSRHGVDRSALLRAPTSVVSGRRKRAGSRSTLEAVIPLVMATCHIHILLGAWAHLATTATTRSNVRCASAHPSCSAIEPACTAPARSQPNLRHALPRVRPHHACSVDSTPPSSRRWCVAAQASPLACRCFSTFTSASAAHATSPPPISHLTTRVAHAGAADLLRGPPCPAGLCAAPTLTRMPLLAALAPAYRS